MKKKPAPWSALMLPLLLLRAADAAEPMDIIFSDRPPLYYQAEDAKGRPEMRGTVYQQVHDVLDAAGLEARFLRQPTARAVSTIRNGERPACGLGWFKTPEREQFASFSEPIARDKPWVVVIQSRHEAAARAAGSLRRLLSLPGLQPSLLGGITHGVELERLLTEAKVPRAMVDPITNLKMIERDHGHYTLLPQGVFEHYASTVNPQTRLKPITMADIPAENLYLMCNRRVGADWMARFNAGLRVATQTVPRLTNK